jgi:endogenous inhibitor of DNA gyrase (YacG/DUF329 family)
MAAKNIKRNSRGRMQKYEANASRTLLGIIKFLERIKEELNKESNPNMVDIYQTELSKVMELIPELSETAYRLASNDQLSTDTEKALTQHAPELSKYINSPDNNTVEEQVDSFLSHVSDIIIDIDEVDCPHCGGSGTTGRVGDMCAFCNGSCVVSKEKHDEYDVNDMDEINCPHCGGSGTTGRVQDMCTFCEGSCVVSQEKHDGYDVNDMGEVNCPHCGGSGTTGRVQDMCTFCEGSCVVSQEKYDGYDVNDMDEVNCPHCGGSGTTGRVQDMCTFCEGSCVVSSEMEQAYINKYGDRY